MQKILSYGNQEDRDVASDFLIFLEKTGNQKAKLANYRIFATEIGYATRKGIQNIERSMFGLQSESSSDLKGVTGLLKALSYKG